MNNLLTLHAEATPDGVNIAYHNNDSMTERVEAISYIDATSRLNAGNYDNKPDEGMSIHLAITDGGNQGYFDYTSQHDVIMWRQLITTVFMLEIRRKDGTVSTIDDTGDPPEVTVYSNGVVVMPLYPATERLVMANSIEGAAIERFSIKSDTERAIIFYRAMVGVEQGALTPLGRETLAELHNNFIAKLDGNGMSAEPVTH